MPVSRRDSGIALALFIVALSYFALTATRTLDPRDAGYLLARSAQVVAGAVPHRDFPDVYGPGVFALTAAAMHLGGGEILAIRILLMLVKAAAVVFGFAIARQLVPAGAAGFSSLIAIAYWGRLSTNLNTPYASLFAIPLCLLALWLLLRALERGSPRGVWVAGAIAGVAILFKQSLGLMAVYGMALAIWGIAMLDAVSDPKNVPRSSASVAHLFGWLLAGLLVLVPAGGTELGTSPLPSSIGDCPEAEWGRVCANLPHHGLISQHFTGNRIPCRRLAAPGIFNEG